jgi:hypothetical protein
MAYIGSWNGRRLDVSTHDFGEDHRDTLLAIAGGQHRLRSRTAYDLERMGLAHVARNVDWGATILTRRGEAMVTYLSERAERWR